jgi:DNA helicase-2/ATP-dependent DNA helicase PcrA
MTRAREQLYLCYAEIRRMHGSENFCRPSRFIDELPAGVVEEIRPRMATSRPYQPARSSARVKSATLTDSSWPFKLGGAVLHPKFGEGTVLAFEGSGEHTRVHVNFPRAGAKWLVLAYANLQPA